jgi:hypothetical protein
VRVVVQRACVSERVERVEPASAVSVTTRQRDVPASAPLHFAKQAAWVSVMPSRCTVSSGIQQSSICSWKILHDPFQTRRGSIAKLFKTIATLQAREQANKRTSGEWLRVVGLGAIHRPHAHTPTRT